MAQKMHAHCFIFKDQDRTHTAIVAFDMSDAIAGFYASGVSVPFDTVERLPTAVRGIGLEFANRLASPPQGDEMDFD